MVRDWIHSGSRLIGGIWIFWRSTFFEVESTMHAELIAVPALTSTSWTEQVNPQPIEIRDLVSKNLSVIYFQFIEINKDPISCCVRKEYGSNLGLLQLHEIDQPISIEFRMI